MTVRRAYPLGGLPGSVRNTAKWAAFCILTVVGWMAYPIDSDGGADGR